MLHVKLLCQKGFSLIEAMVGLGLMTAVGVGVMQLQTNQVKTQKSIDVDYETKILASVIYDQLKTKSACESTFSGRNFVSGAFNFNQILDSDGNIIFSSPQDYDGKNNLRILRFVAEPQTLSPSPDPIFLEGAVRVAFDYQKSSNVLNNQNNYKQYIKLPIRIKVLAATGQLHSCITASDDAIETSLSQFCESLNGAFDSTNELCDLDANFADTSINGVNSSSLNQGVSSMGFGDGLWENLFRDLYVDKNRDNNIRGLVHAQRNVILATAASESMDAVRKVDLDARVTCPSGQAGFMTSSGIRCTDLLCDNPLEYMAGVNSNGEKLCLPLISGADSCPNGGGRLNAQSGGGVGFECCTPSCDAPGAYCIGDTFPSSNNCGTCQGTAQPVIEGTWTPWTDTGETRQLTDECVDNQIPTEKKQTRSCVMNTTLASCQELTCAGSDEQWVAGTPVSCGAPPGKCKGSGSDSAGLFVHAFTTEVQNGCRTQYREQHFDIVVSEFKVGNIYSMTQGMTFSEEVRAGDTPQSVLQRIANKINAQNMTYPTLCNGSGSTVVTRATVISSNRIRYHINWQHSTSPSASRSCNNLDEATCTATPNCNWDTTSENVCTGMNYTVPQGNCSGTYSIQTCMPRSTGGGYDMGFGTGSGGNSNDGYACRYSYPDQASCMAAPYSENCTWGYEQQTCYASSASQCSALGGGCRWTAHPDVHRSCTAAWGESECTGAGAGVCSWGPR